MRIAILYSGHLRSLPTTISAHIRQLKLLKKEHQVDVFVHTWSEIDSGDSSWWRNSENPTPLNPAISRTITRLNPLNVSIETAADLPKVWFTPGMWGGPREIQVAATMVGMWSSIYQTWLLCRAEELKSGDLYDIVIRTRPDIVWDMNFEVTQFLRDFQPRFPEAMGAERIPSDLAFVVAREQAEILCNFINSGPAQVKQYADRHYRQLIAEVALGAFVQDCDIPWASFQSDVLIVRKGPGTFVWPSDSRHRVSHLSTMKYSRSARPVGDWDGAGIDPSFVVDIAFITGVPLHDPMVSSVMQALNLFRSDPEACCRIVAKLRSEVPNTLFRFFLDRVWFNSWRLCGCPLRLLNLGSLMSNGDYYLRRRISLMRQRSRLVIGRVFPQSL